MHSLLATLPQESLFANDLLRFKIKSIFLFLISLLFFFTTSDDSGLYPVHSDGT